jgi:type II secretory pathway component GspD/PulD (secretin)
MLFLLFITWNVIAQSQKIRVDAVDIPLDEVFIELRDKYGFQFTFDDKFLSKFKITVHREFESKQAVVSYLLQGFPLEFDKSGEVFVIFRSQEKNSQYKK